MGIITLVFLYTTGVLLVWAIVKEAEARRKKQKKYFFMNSNIKNTAGPGIDPTVYK